MVYSVADAKRQFSDLLKRAAYRGEVVTIGTRRKPEAALVSVEEWRRLREMELERDAGVLADLVARSAGTVGARELLRAWRGSSGASVRRSARGEPRKPRRAAAKRILRRGRG